MATINLLVVVGLVGVQGSQLPGGYSSKLCYSISNICSLNIIIIIGVKHTGSDTMQQILGVGIKASESKFFANKVFYKATERLRF